MKKTGVVFVVMVAILLLFLPRGVLAAGNVGQNDVGIHFEKSTDTTDTEEPSKKNPTENPPKLLPSTNGSKNGALPHLGQMITSFILLLGGVACLIAFCGIILFRKIYYSV